MADSYLSYSPYHYAGNNPATINDPTGAVWGIVHSVYGSSFGELGEGGSGWGGSSGFTGLSNPGGLSPGAMAMVNHAWNNTQPGEDRHWVNTNNTVEGMASSLMSGGFAHGGYYYYTTGQFYSGGGKNVTINGVEATVTMHEVPLPSQQSQNTSSNWLDNLQTALDLGGIADPTGIADGVNALIYAGRGQWGNAAISAMGIIPYIGDAGKAGRLGSKAAKVIGDLKIPVYRVYGNGASMYGKSYSVINPKYVPFYRNFAGLPNVNSGEYLLKGSLQLRDINIGRWFAAPLDGNTGSLPFELYQSFDQLVNPVNIIIKKPF